MKSRHLKVVPPPAPLRAAIYARVSSDQQAERQTIDSQLSELKALASREGHEVEGGMLFVDDGHSGASLVRPALERLRDMVALSAVRSRRSTSSTSTPPTGSPAATRSRSCCSRSSPGRPCGSCS